MPTNYKLTWRKDGRWQKFYPGRYYYFALTECETKTSSYQRAFQDWLRLKGELDREHHSSSELDARKSWAPVVNAVRESQQQVINQYGDSAETREIWQTLERMFINDVVEPAIQERRMIGPVEQEFWLYQIEDAAKDLCQAHWQVSLAFLENMGTTRGQAPAGTPPWEDDRNPTGNTSSLEILKEQFLAAVKDDASLRRASNVRRDVDAFIESIPGVSTVAQAFDSRILSDYLSSVKRLSIKSSTKRDKIASVKQFATWAFEREHIETLPRLIQAGKFKVEVRRGKVVTFSDDEMTEILSAAIDRNRLYILLALNCGYTQADISDIAPSEVDLNAGTVTRKRSKTQGEEEVPEVTYTLWPETLELVRRYAASTGDLLLLNTKGRPLVLVSEDDDGNAKRTDAIAKSMERMRKKMKREKPISFKYFRKTASSELAQHETYKTYAQYFLGHAPSTVADAHYVVPSQQQFDAAIAWLRVQFLGD